MSDILNTGDRSHDDPSLQLTHGDTRGHTGTHGDTRGTAQWADNGRLMQSERSPTDDRDQEVIEAAESSEGEETILKMFCKSKINI